MFKKVIYRIFGFIDETKAKIFNVGLKLLMVVFVLVILHNIIKMSEVSSMYTGEYKHLVPINEETLDMMNVYSVGEGSKTIVILAGFGSQSPEIQYKALVDGLKDEYRVIVVEYFGYGYSMARKIERSNDNIVEEVKTALEKVDAYGPYVLMPHDHSNVYAMYFEQKYPELVESIVSIDGLYPEEINYEYYQIKNRSDLTNINITSIFEFSGFERITSYLMPKTFYIDKMKKMPNSYGKEEIKVYRNRIGSQYLSRTMVREAKKLAANMEQMKNYKYPEFLPVLEILSEDRIKEYANYKKDGADVDLENLAENVITNQEIQKVEKVKGDHNLHLSNPEKVVEITKEFLHQH